MVIIGGMVLIGINIEDCGIISDKVDFVRLKRDFGQIN